MNFKAQNLVVMLLVIGLMLLVPESAFAETPWDKAIRTLACTVKGPWLKWLAVISIVVAGAAFAVGEMKGPMKTAMNIVAGISIALGATSMAMIMFDDGGPQMNCPSGNNGNIFF